MERYQKWSQASQYSPIKANERAWPKEWNQGNQARALAPLGVQGNDSGGGLVGAPDEPKRRVLALWTAHLNTLHLDPKNRSADSKQRSVSHQALPRSNGSSLSR